MRILHLEDNASDADLIRSLLCSQWPDCAVTEVNSREAFEATVRHGEYDLILSDYSLPNYNGLDALAFARSHNPEKPFIYLSGTIGEDRAIQALKSGATDYILKDRPARLIPAIKTALSQIEKDKARRRAEEMAYEQAALLDKSREAICVTDAEGQVTFWNASAERLYGWNAVEAIGRNLREIVYREDLPRFDAAYALVLANGEWRGELHPQASSGATVLVESFWTLVTDEAGRARKILIIDTDITEKRKLENQLFQTQRLETLGLLVGGIAHDLNNMLAPIVTSVDLLRERMACEEDREMLGALEVSAQHGAELVRQLLSFARGGTDLRSEINVGALIGSTRRLLLSVVPSTIGLRSHLEDPLWPVHADATQLRQVLLNLCLNARDAMPDGGSITLQASGVEVDATSPGVPGEMKAGRYVRMSVTDTGTGIPPEIASKIFEPFFTTKQPGKGTGLGLANVAAIVQAHGGFIALDSKPGAGTTFHVYLPALVREATNQVPAESGPMIQGRGENLLVIEDDEGVRTVLELLLSTRGYHVTLAENAEEGLQQLYAQPSKFAAVITDLRMPGKSGLDVIREVNILPAPPKVLMISGSLSHLQEETLAVAGVEVLRKPMTTDSLLGTLRRVLMGPSL